MLLMFKFFKKLQRRENFKLIASCSQMARRLQSLHESSKAFYVGDDESLQLFESMTVILKDLNELELWLEHNEVLVIEESKELLNLHWKLTNMVKQMEEGRKEGERLAKERLGL